MACERRLHACRPSLPQKCSLDHPAATTRTPAGTSMTCSPKTYACKDEFTGNTMVRALLGGTAWRDRCCPLRLCMRAHERLHAWRAPSRCRHCLHAIGLLHCFQCVHRARRHGCVARRTGAAGPGWPADVPALQPAQVGHAAAGRVWPSLPAALGAPDAGCARRRVAVRPSRHARALLCRHLLGRRLPLLLPACPMLCALIRLHLLCHAFPAAPPPHRRGD